MRLPYDRARRLASAKTSAPALDGIVPRSRLFRVLDRSRAPAVWLTGPPGSGKTALAAGYLEARKRSVLWYQLDADDSDPATFFYELGLAVGHRFGRRGRAPLRLLKPEFQASLLSFARQFFRELYRRVKTPLAVVLDDYHVVADSSPLHDVLAVAVSERPRGDRLFVLSRTGPPGTLARLRASGTLAVRPSSDLPLTLAETTAIVRRRVGRRISQRAIRDLHKTTGGWVAGLILYIEQQGWHPGSVVQEQSRDAVFDYFAGEIFRTESEPVQRALIETAFVSPMSPEVVAQLTDSPESPRVLETFSRRHYFTERRAGPEVIYRYHPLFREFLQARARETLPPARLAELRRRAGRVLAGAGRGSEAAELFRDAKDWPGLSHLILEQASSLAAQGRTQVLETWLAYLPGEEIDRDPWLKYWLGMCRLPVDPAASRQAFEGAFQLFDARGEDAGRVHAWCGVVESVLYEWSDFTLLDPWIDRLGDIWGAAQALQDAEVEARVAFGIHGALMFRRPHHPEMAAWAERALALANRTKNISQRVVASSHVAHYFYWIGDLARASAIVGALDRAPQLRDAAPMTRLNLKMTNAIEYWHRGETDRCVEQVSDGLKEARATGVHLWDCALLAQSVYGTLSAGRLGEGRACLQKMGAVLQERRRLDVSHHHYLTAWEAILQGDTAAARRHLEMAFSLLTALGAIFPLALATLALADLAWDTGDRAAAAQHLDRARTIGREMRSLMLQFLARMLEARFAFDLGDDLAGIASLREGMQIGRAQGIFNTPWWRRPVMAALCGRALAAGIEVEYVRALVRRQGLIPDTPLLDVEAWPWPIKVLTLQRFRMERDGAPVRPGRKIQQRPLALMKALVAFGPRDVREDRIVDALWPDAEGDAAHRIFAITLHRARQLVGLDGAIVRRGARLSLDPRVCWVDAWAFERLCDRAEAAERAGRGGEARALIERAAVLYHQPFLAEHPDDLPWAVPVRERLRGKFVQAVVRRGQQYREAGRWPEAVAWYERGLDAEPLAEELCCDLMGCLLHLGRQREALAAYERCRRALAVLGLSPSARSEAIRQQAAVPS